MKHNSMETEDGRKNTTAEVRVQDGAPTLFLNGSPVAAMAYMTYRPDRRYFEQFAGAGVRLYSFSATPTESAYGFAQTCWTGPDTFDDIQFEERVRMVLEADPQAYIFPRLYLGSPRWWDDRHPDELVARDHGDGKPIPFLYDGRKGMPSWASQAWRQDTAEALVRLIRHIEASAYADRVIGYHLGSGHTEEWIMWGAQADFWADRSPANVAGFRAWLRTEYADDESLRAAWRDPAVTIATAGIPDKVQIQTSHLGDLRDPVADRRAIDYGRYTSDLTADTIRFLAGVVKEATRRRKLVGVFYGYALELAVDQRQQTAGHLALRRVWDCPDIDFVSSPSSYTFRLPGSGHSCFMTPVDGLKLAGKLWFDENDIRTWLVPGGAPAWTGYTDTYEGTLGQLRRELANVLCHACGQWWFDMGGGWYDDPRLMAEIARLRSIADRSLAWDRSPADEIAVIVDDAGFNYLRPGNGLSPPLVLRQILELARLGAPVGYYTLDDLDRLPPRRMVVFLNAFAPTEAQRAAIDKLKADGHLLVWIFAAGLFHDGRADEDAMQALTGIRLRLDPDTGPLRVECLKGTPAATGGTYGADGPLAPQVHADDPDAEVWGRLAGSERAGLVVKDLEGWASVFSAAPALPAPLLRTLAVRAGVHLYIEPCAASNDVVYANRSLLALCADQPGPRTLRLPGRYDVYDLFAEREVGENMASFGVDMDLHETRLWQLARRE